ncbi:MAG TPA: hypothetical protein VF297_27200 [Pyrinomonadaceae bacterium]
MASLILARKEIQRRAALLPREVNVWHEGARANVGGLGIHLSQFNALKLMMDGLWERQAALLEELKPSLPAGEFADKYLSLTDEIVGAHDLWRIFRYIMAQHADEALKQFIVAADHVAADCYRTCMNKARLWKLVREEELREPPLVYLEAGASPSTASRGMAAETLSLPLRRYRNMRLPIPIVLLPFDHATSFWTLCNLYHEVGHNLDQDLKLRQELGDHLLTRMGQEGWLAERQQSWWKWGGEILADVFGVLLGGAGFAYSLCWWLLALAPAERFRELDSRDVHPPPYVRVHLIAALLRESGSQELAQAAAAILAEWEAQPKPDWVAPYLAEGAVVVDVFLNQKLTALGGERTLRDFNDDLDGDAERVRQVAACLPKNFNCPDPALIEFTPRLLPAAAQLALSKLGEPTAELLDKLQANALAYFQRVPRPDFLAGAGREEFLRGLVRRVEF